MKSSYELWQDKAAGYWFLATACGLLGIMALMVAGFKTEIWPWYILWPVSFGGGYALYRSLQMAWKSGCYATLAHLRAQQNQRDKDR